MNIVKWFKDQSFFKKMTMIYVIFAVLPMIFVTAYNYIQTSRILQEKSYQDMQQNMETTGKSLETFFESYSTIMDLLYTNQTMYNYLGIDYTELSYGEMFYYTDRQLLHNTLLFLSAGSTARRLSGEGVKEGGLGSGRRNREGRRKEVCGSDPEDELLQQRRD